MASKVLGINAGFHDPAAALVLDGVTVAAAEEERFNRRKHGKDPVAFSTWELPERAAAWCIEHAGLAPADLDVVAYSYDPALATTPSGDIMGGTWEGLRTLFAERAPRFLATSLPGLDPERVRFVPHHVAHAASAYLAAGYDSCAVLTLDGRGEGTSALAGHVGDGTLKVLAEQPLPQSLGLVYESLTAHLGFRRASDEYKVMALASSGEPRRRGLGSRARRSRLELAAAPRGGAAGASRLAARLHGREQARDGGRGGAQLRGELEALVRRALRRGLGPAGRRRRRDGARRGALRREGSRRVGGADGDRRSRTWLGAARAGGVARPRGASVRAARRRG